MRPLAFGYRRTIHPTIGTPHWRPVVASLLVAASSLALAISPVAATYPGATNGRLAFAIKGIDGNPQISTVMPDGTDLKTLTSGAFFHACAAYSADGSKIAYCSNETGAFEIWTMNADGSGQAQLTELGGMATFPDYSPDGANVAFGGTQPTDTHTEILTVDAATGATVTALTSCAGSKPGCGNDFPAWSPDGTKIAWIHTPDVDTNGDPVGAQVWVMDADGGNAHALTTDAPNKDQLPDWSPDGSKIAYESGPGGSGGIWVMNSDGSDQHQLIGCAPTDPSPCATGDYGGPVWSPDGLQIAFLSFPSDPSDRPVMTMNADGSNPHRVIASPSIDFVPAWQPVGVGTPSASPPAGSPAASESASVATPDAVLDIPDATGVIRLAADGEDILIAANGAIVHVNGQTNAETRITASDVSAGAGAFAVGADGLWIGRFGQNQIERLDPTTGSVELKSAASEPISFMFLGDDTWVGLRSGGLYPVDRTTGALGAKIGQEMGWATGSGTLWEGSGSGSQVTRFDPSTGTALATIPVPSGSGCGLLDASVHGEMWAACSVFQRDPGPNGTTIARIDPGTNSVTGVAAVPGFSAELLVDGTLWLIVPRDQPDGTIASSLVVIDPATWQPTLVRDLGPLDADTPVVTTTALWIPDEQGRRVLKFDLADFRP